MRISTNALLGLSVALAVAAGALLAFEPASPRATDDYQSTVGGVGVGVAVDPAPCARAFDGRVAPWCSWRHGPVAGGDRFCPLHGFGTRR